MAYLVIEINATNLQVADLNERCLVQGDKGDCANGVANLVAALAASAVPGTIQITSRATTASVATDADPKSTQKSF